MAIAFDSAPGGFALSGGTTTTQSFTNTAGNLVLLGIDLNTSTVTATVTYGGVAMTAHPSNPTDISGYRCQTFYLIGAATGANNFVITLSSALGGSAVPVSYSGIGTGSVIDASNVATSASTTSLGVTVTTVADNCWVMGFWRNGVGGTTPGAGTTQRGGAGNNLTWMDNNAAKTPPGAVTITGTWSPAGFGYVQAMSFSPTDVITVNANFFALM